MYFKYSALRSGCLMLRFSVRAKIPALHESGVAH